MRGTIDVHSIFPTIQGEGPFCGERALFIRLYGCNLQCPGCDTEYTANREAFTPDKLLLEVVDRDWAKGALVVITGGEPFRQNITPTVEVLLAHGYRVQIETNGVLSLPDFPFQHPRCYVVCSPKTSRISPLIAAHADAFKYVLRSGEIADDGLPTVALGHAATPFVARPRKDARVYVQPMDEQDEELNKRNTAAAIASAMAHDHILQIQTHKILGLE